MTVRDTRGREIDGAWSLPPGSGTLTHPVYDIGDITVQGATTVRGKPAPAEIVPMPFVKHTYYRG